MANIHLNIVGKHQQCQQGNQNILWQGFIYLDGKPASGLILLDYIRKFAYGNTSDLVQHLNGFYNFVFQCEGGLFAAVDHIRSRPLFYGRMGGDFYLSDDAEWLRQQLNERHMDPVAREEFLLTGYVTGSDTLFSNLKQLQAGECVSVQNVDGVLKVKMYRHYRFVHEEPENPNHSELRNKLDDLAIASARRLIEYANGRQIVVPLSGGYDSRLVVTLLKRLGYENILTFTYGVSGNKESIYSKRVADALGLRWYFVEYTSEEWKKVWKKNDSLSYQNKACSWTSLPHMQDWLAVKAMKKQGFLDPDCVFVPGHSGDFVAGSHIPNEAMPGVSASTADMLNSILASHYIRSPFNLVSNRPVQYWLNRVSERTDFKQVADGVSFADAFEMWDWQERQAKYICNSVRVYEFFGYDWWLPLWDSEYMCFWQKVPLSLRKGRSWYLDYVKSEFAEIGKSREANLDNASDYSILNKLTRKLLSNELKNTVKKIINKLAVMRVVNTKRLDVQSNFLLAGAEKEKLNRLQLEGYSVLGAYAWFVVNDFEQHINKKEINDTGS